MNVRLQGRLTKLEAILIIQEQTKCTVQHVVLLAVVVMVMTM
jgi:hypothetical protein